MQLVVLNQVLGIAIIIGIITIIFMLAANAGFACLIGT